MVTTTNEHDELPTHDALGTDLRRVAAMLAAGYSERLMMQALGTTAQRIRYAVAVITQDREGSPTEEEIAAACEELQAGWTTEMAVAARHGLPRLSSRVVQRNFERNIEVRKAAARERQRWIVEHAPIRIHVLTNARSDRVFEARVHLFDKCSRKAFATREEAEAWGRAWLVERWNQRQAEACCSV